MKNRIDRIERCVNVMSSFRANHKHGAGDEDKNSSTRHGHSVDKSGKNLGLKAYEVLMCARKVLETYRKWNFT